MKAAFARPCPPEPRFDALPPEPRFADAPDERDDPDDFLAAEPPFFAADLPEDFFAAEPFFAAPAFFAVAIGTLLVVRRARALSVSNAARQAPCMRRATRYRHS